MDGGTGVRVAPAPLARCYGDGNGVSFPSAGRKDVPTEEVRRAFYQLKKEDLEEILADFLADPVAFGSMRQRLFEAGRRRELEDGIVLASNDSWAHEAACPGRLPLKPHETEDAS